MLETWLKHAHPGLPRACAYLMGWLVLPFILPVVICLDLVVHGVSAGSDLFAAVGRESLLYWRQRTTLSSDPWQKVRL